MEIDIETVIELYKNNVAEINNELILSKAQVITLQKKIGKLENLLKENGIDIIQ